MNINPSVLKSAREKANFSLEEACKKISSHFQEWEKGESEPTLNQIKQISEKLYIPFGYFFLEEFPKYNLTIPDFRTKDNQEIAQPSINLLSTIYDVQRKQNWLQEQKILDQEEKIINEKQRSDKEIIKEIRSLLEIEKLRKENTTFENFLKSLIEKLDEKEFIIIRNGIVGNNTHRPLKVEEFKGFALFDEYAPAIFINGKDYKSSQIFTLIHELVHLYLNESGLDGNYEKTIEQKCNKIAAEILLPEKDFKKVFDISNLENIAKTFKVSNYVILIKAKQLNLINEKEFQNQLKKYKEKINSLKQITGGGNFYKNVKFKAGGNSFLLRVFHSVKAGETLYRDAYALTGLSAKSFDKYFQKN